jgi:hypothetical protein
VAATVFFVLVGTAVVLASQPQSNAATTANQSESGTVDPNNVQPTFVPPVPEAGKGSALPPGGNDEPQAGDDRGDQDFRPGYVMPYDGSPRDPGPEIGSGGGDSGLIDPVSPNPDTRITPMTPPPTTTGGGQGLDSSNPPPDVIEEDPNPPKRETGGVIKIGPSSSGGNGGTVPPTSDSDADMSAKSLVEVARSHYVRGDYAKSAAAYEKALRAGAEPASTNHRLGDCYRNLGRKAEAITAYERAIQGYQAQIDRGVNPDVPKAGIAACQQALKVLRGG